MTRRRELLLMLLAGSLLLPSPQALADDGGDGGGDGGGHGGDDGGGDGGDNHGGGSGDDNGGDDNHGGGSDDDGDDDQGFGGSAGTARDAVSQGQAIPLKDVLKLVKAQYPGQVIHVDVNRSAKGLFYKIQLLDPTNQRIEVTVNATTQTIVQAGLY